MFCGRLAGQNNRKSHSLLRRQAIGWIHSKILLKGCAGTSHKRCDFAYTYNIKDLKEKCHESLYFRENWFTKLKHSLAEFEKEG